MKQRRVGRYFTLAELCRTNVRLPNEPTKEIIDNLHALVDNVLDAVREKFGPTIIHSGYRNPVINKLIGGSPRSQHMEGKAADFHCVNVHGSVNHYAIARYIYKNLEFDQLILEFCTCTDSAYNEHFSKKERDHCKGWIHLSFSEGNNRTQFMRATWELETGQVKYELIDELEYISKI